MRFQQTSFFTDVSLFYCFNIEPTLRRFLSSTMTAVAMFALIGTGWTHGLHGENRPEPLVSQSRANIAPFAIMKAGSLPQEPPLKHVLWYDRRILCSRRSVAARKKVKRTRAEIARERQALLDKTNREIDAIVAEFHAKLPREQAKSIGSIYSRYSSRFQDSIADQVRTLFEDAYAKGIFIPRELVFFDMAVRGWKDRRPGLTSLRVAIKAKKFDAFLVFSTSRLFRRTYKSLQFVEEELVERGIRAIFLKSNIDTNDGDNWRTMFQLFAAFDEATVRMYGSHVQAAHEGLFIRGMVCTSLTVGYTGEVVPGEFTKRQRPRRRIIIDPEAAPWIEKIFNWYVLDLPPVKSATVRERILPGRSPERIY